MTYILELTESVVLESVISMVYFALCTLLFFVGVTLAQKREEKVWSVTKSEGLLLFGEKLRLFIFSPTVIVAIGLTVLDCISMITIG